MTVRNATACLALLLSGPAVSQDEEASGSETFAAVAAGAREDLEAALAELSALREAIAAEKPVLAAETNQRAADLREARRQADLAKTDREASEAELLKLENDLEAWRKEREYVQGLLLDFENTCLATRPAADWEKDFGSENFDGESIAATLNQLQAAATPAIASGTAVSPDGTLVPGSFVEIGPLTWFLSDDRTTAGVITSDEALRPRVVEGSAPADGIAQLLAGEAAVLRFDPTLGNAVTMEETRSTLLERIREGGFWMYPILMLAAIALIAAIAKWIQLARIRPLLPERVDTFLQQLREEQFEAALATARSVRHPAGKLLSRCAGILQERKIQDRDEAEEALFEVFLEAQPRLKSGLPLIAIASATAPLLGLLGTVTGMIETFKLINIFGTGDARALASGISEALVTTEFGLIVAIPALILHALLSRKVQGIKSQMEMTSLALLNGAPFKGTLPAESFTPSPQSA